MKGNILNLLKDISIKQPEINRRRGGFYDYVQFGSDNIFPQFLLNLIKNSPLQNAIVESFYTRLGGAGIIAPNIQYPNVFDSWEELLRKVLRDYSIFESFCIQAVLNMDGVTWSFYHQPISEVRLGKANEYNKIEKAYICTDWSYKRGTNIEEIKMYGSETPKKGEKYLMYFKPYFPQEYYYHIPSYFSAANWIEADSRLSKYYNNFIANNLNANKLIYYPFKPEKKEQDEIYESLVSNFSGDSNSGSFMLLFGEGELKPEIQDINTPDADLYNEVYSIVQRNIISGNRLTSETLAGISIGSGFSSQADQLIAAETHYNLNVVLPARNFILSKFNGLLLMNACTDKMEIKDYSLRKEYEGDITTNDLIESEVQDGE